MSALRCIWVIQYAVYKLLHCMCSAYTCLPVPLTVASQAFKVLCGRLADAVAEITSHAQQQTSL